MIALRSSSTGPTKAPSARSTPRPEGAWGPALTADPVALAVVGAGDRGRRTYGRWCLEHPQLARVMAVAEPDPARRAAFAADHGLGATAFSSWQALLAAAPSVDAIVIATPDREHAAPAIAAMDAGYDVLLEKPIAPTPEEVAAVAAAAERTGRSVTVAHVLRYTPFFAAIRMTIDEGRIGEVVTITHAERIGYWHFAHSFVRGNWRREAEASPMLLAKACHDLDLISWLAGDRCTAVASFGGLRHFRPEQAPPDAADRCWDGERRCPVAAGCPFDAVRLYVERTAEVDGWPVSVVTADPSPVGRLAALAAGPYGRCAYRCDNDVADHQVVALEFANGVRATLTVSGLTADNTRTIIVGGTRGEIHGRLDTGEIEIRRFLPATTETDGRWDRDDLGRHAMRDDDRLRLSTASLPLDGHGGGDDAMLADLVERIRARREGTVSSADARTSLAASVESHDMAFAAERSRRERRLVELDGR